MSLNNENVMKIRSAKDVINGSPYCASNSFIEVPKTIPIGIKAVDRDNPCIEGEVVLLYGKPARAQRFLFHMVNGILASFHSVLYVTTANIQEEQIINGVIAASENVKISNFNKQNFNKESMEAICLKGFEISTQRGFDLCSAYSLEEFIDYFKDNDCTYDVIVIDDFAKLMQEPFDIKYKRSQDNIIYNNVLKLKTMFERSGSVLICKMESASFNEHRVDNPFAVHDYPFSRQYCIFQRGDEYEHELDEVPDIEYYCLVETDRGLSKGLSIPLVEYKYDVKEGIYYELNI